MSKDLVDRFAQLQQISNSCRRHEGKHAVGFATRFRRGPKHRARVVAAAGAQRQWGTSPQPRQQMSASRKGRSQPKRWKDVGNGQIATDWKLASLRLDGKEQSDIAAKCGLTRPTITVRLQRIGFPLGKPCRFFRGEPVTEKRLRAHHEDLKFLRVLRQLFLYAESDHNESGDLRVGGHGAA